MSDQVFIFGALVIGTALAVVTTLLILRAAGLIKKAPAGAPPPLLNPLLARVPDLKLLPEAEQHRIARAAMRHPIVWDRSWLCCLRSAGSRSPTRAACST